MIILYKQPNTESVFDKIGISNCWVKHLCSSSDSKSISLKKHHHTGFEIHCILKGHQTYAFEDGETTVHPGEMLIIPPGIKHQSIETSSSSEKISLTFKASPGSPFEQVTSVKECEIPKGIFDNLRFFLEEFSLNGYASEALMCTRTFETLVLLLRIMGHNETEAKPYRSAEDYRLTLAKQYIFDNIESAPTVSEIATYCYLSPKQLTRIFVEGEGLAPATYIRKIKTEKIEKLLMSPLSLKEISEKMSFSDEYHFNSFFRKNSGMTPGEYRKMQKLK